MTTDKLPRFCKLCGGGLENRMVDQRSRPVCVQCGDIQYRQLIVGAGCLIEEGERLLLIRRLNEPFRGSWCLPAGHVDDNEAPVEAAPREALEETGLQVQAQQLVDPYFFDDHPEGCGVFLVYRCSVLSGTLQQTAEGSTPTYFARDEIPGSLAGGGHRVAIERWVKQPRQNHSQPVNLNTQLSVV